MHQSDASGDFTYTIDSGVTSIGSGAFRDCTRLTSVFFHGNAPPSVGSDVFVSSHPTIYRRHAATGWVDPFADRPVRIWPEVMTAGIGPAGLTFNLAASDSQEFIVEASPEIATLDWQPIYTGTVVSAESYDFTDPAATDYPQRFYRIVLD